MSAARDAREVAAAARVARAIAGYMRVDVVTDGYVASLPEAFAEIDGWLLRAAGLVACDEQRDDGYDGAQEALALLARARDAMEWAVRRPLENAGVLPARDDAKVSS